MLPFFVFSYEERRNALANLIKITREGEQDIWTEHFKTVLLMLLETLDDQNVSPLSLLLFHFHHYANESNDDSVNQ